MVLVTHVNFNAEEFGQEDGGEETRLLDAFFCRLCTTGLHLRKLGRTGQAVAGATSGGEKLKVRVPPFVALYTFLFNFSNLQPFAARMPFLRFLQASNKNTYTMKHGTSKIVSMKTTQKYDRKTQNQTKTPFFSFFLFFEKGN